MITAMILAWSAGVLAWLGKRGRLADYGKTVLAVLLFELLTEPLWRNTLPHPWAYLFKDVSWVLTLAWANGILTATWLAGVVDRGSEAVNFLVTVVVASLLGLAQEWILVAAGVRGYPERLVESHLIRGPVPGTALPMEALYYVPVFLTLVIGLSRFWSLSDDVASPRRSHP